jgi:RHS repeat-associated protein
MLHTTSHLSRAFIAALALATTGSAGFAADAQYYVNDPLATTVAITDSAGEIAAMEADAFGAPLAIGEEPGRFTGKPYDADLGAFVFPFRNYRPEEGRWMSADPSGFPDGVNGRIYAPCPLSGLDPLGLQSVSVRASDIATVQAAIEGFRTLGWDAAVRRARHSQDGGGNETAPQNEIDALFTASEFTDVINDSYFETIFKNNGSRAFDYRGTYSAINYGVSNGVPLNDLAASYGRLGGSIKGQYK